MYKILTFSLFVETNKLIIGCIDDYDNSFHLIIIIILIWYFFSKDFEVTNEFMFASITLHNFSIPDHLYMW
jgi:hypothetical protein